MRTETTTGQLCLPLILRWRSQRVSKGVTTAEAIVTPSFIMQGLHRSRQRKASLHTKIPPSSGVFEGYFRGGIFKQDKGAAHRTAQHRPATPVEDGLHAFEDDFARFWEYMQKLLVSVPYLIGVVNRNFEAQNRLRSPFFRSSRQPPKSNFSLMAERKFLYEKEQ